MCKVRESLYLKSCLKLCSENALLNESNMSEDAPITDDGDNERQQHADDDKQDGVVVGDSAVPQTLLSLGVEPVRRPAKVVRGVEGNTGQPRHNDSDDSVTAGKPCVILGVPANVQVTVDADGEQRHDTADDTEAGCCRTQPPSSIQQAFLSHHCTFNAKESTNYHL